MKRIELFKKPHDGLLTRAEMADYLNISERKLSTMVELKQIPVMRFGRCVRFKLAEVDKVLKENFTIEAE